jgi:hypothetical protein
MEDFLFNWTDALQFNDTVINGTAAYQSAYVVVYGSDLLVLLHCAEVVILLVILAFMVMRLDLK